MKSINKINFPTVCTHFLDKDLNTFCIATVISSELDIVCGAALDLIRFTARDRRGICIGGGEGGQIYLVKDKKEKP